LSVSSSGPQAHVDSYFDEASAYWNTVYGQSGLQALVYRRRMEVAARWAAELGPTPPATAIDVGCGAGLMSLELARAGLSVIGTDSSPEMVAGARRLVAEQNLADQIEVRQADVHSLPFRSDDFGLVVALGLLPWLHDPATAVGELARVLRPGGTIILTADNRHRLNRLVEPRENPLLTPVRLARRRLRERAGRSPAGPDSYLHEPLEVDSMLAATGITVLRRATIGFGPFTVLGRPFLPDGPATRLHEALQRAGERHLRLRGTGWHYVVLGVKDGPDQGAREPGRPEPAAPRS
jgi:ubiquinone/menaquinone biosynthesis C-methylase UbiE